MKFVCSGVLAAIVLFASVGASADEQLWEFLPQNASDRAETIVLVPFQDGAPAQSRFLALGVPVMALQTGERFEVPLLDGTSAQAFIEENVPTRLGARRITARFVDRSHGGFVLYAGQTGMMGQVWTGDQGYEIFGGPASGYLMKVAAPAGFGSDYVDLRVPILERGSESATAAASGDTNLDFLFLYDQSMIDRYDWGLLFVADREVDLLDMAFANSNVALTASIADLEFMDVPEATPSASVLSDAVAGLGVFSGLSARTDVLGADIVTLHRNYLTGRDTACGLSDINDPTVDIGVRFHLVLCNMGLRTAHLTGHNLGLVHGPSVDGESGPTGLPVSWAQGFRIDNDPRDGESFSSVMVEVFPQEILFSNPDIACPDRGSVCGVPVGQAGAADAARALRDYATGLPTSGVTQRRLRSAMLPTSRRVEVGAPATAFMTVINVADVDGVNCRIQHHGPNRDWFTYQRTDAATNAAVGNPNEPVNIPAGGFQTFVVSLTLPEAINPATFSPIASCDNIPFAEVTPGLNSLNLDTRGAAESDIIALAATIGNTGVVDIPDDRRGVFSVATVNLGATQMVNVRAVSLAPEMPATAQICQTDSGGACIEPPVDVLTLEIEAGAAPTFGVFIRTDYPTPFSPRNRFQFQIYGNGVFDIVGSTSVAVRDQGAIQTPTVVDSGLEISYNNTRSRSTSIESQGFVERYELVTLPTLGTVELDMVTGEYIYTASALSGMDSFTYRAVNSAGPSNTGTATITVAPVAPPGANDFSVEEDAGYELAFDLDRFASGLIERFRLVTSPAIAHSFDPVSGRMSMTLPIAPQEIEFTYVAEGPNEASQHRVATIVAAELTNCVRRDMTSDRILRRVERFELGGSGIPTMDEASALGEYLCLNETRRTEFGVEFTGDEGRIPTISIRPFTNFQADDGRSGYSLYFQSVNPTWIVSGALCMSESLTRLERC
jgi:hypothetical protein